MQRDDVREQGVFHWFFGFCLRKSQFKDVIVCFLRRASWRYCTFFRESQFEMKMYCWVGFIQRFLLEIYLEFVVDLLLFTYYTNREHATPLWFLARWDSWLVYDQEITLPPQSWSGAEPRRHTIVWLITQLKIELFYVFRILAHFSPSCFCNNFKDIYALVFRSS